MITLSVDSLLAWVLYASCVYCSTASIYLLLLLLLLLVRMLQLLFCCCLQSDEALVREMAAFRQASFQYVCMMQDIHAQKQYELMEPVS